MKTDAEARGPGGARRPLLEARAVDFAYRPGAPVVREASLAVGGGTLAALIGANGCGKSTMTRLLAGLVRPARGEVFLEGKPLESVPRRERARRVAYVPQSTPTTFPFTALEVVVTGRSPYSSGLHFESQADCEKARRALETVGAGHLESRRMTELSGGERQLVGMARALAQEPACLLLDEPASALDLKHRAGLIRLLARLREREGLAALVVTHDLALLDPVFDRVFGMRCGAVVAEGTPSEVLRDEVLAALYDDPNVRARRIEGRTFVWSES